MGRASFQWLRPLLRRERREKREKRARDAAPAAAPVATEPWADARRVAPRPPRSARDRLLGAQDLGAGGSSLGSTVDSDGGVGGMGAFGGVVAEQEPLALESFVPYRPGGGAPVPERTERIAERAERVEERADAFTVPGRFFRLRRDSDGKKRRRGWRKDDVVADIDEDAAAASVDRFVRERDAASMAPESDNYFGAAQTEAAHIPEDTTAGAGEAVLLKFIRRTLGNKAQGLAVRLMNKNPITSNAEFRYVIHQGTEESDIDIIRRDLQSGRLYSSGVRLIGGAWCNLLLGDRFMPGSSRQQRHELTYHRTSCTCITCLIRTTAVIRQELEARALEDDSDAGTASTATAEILSSAASSTRTPSHSAMANFVVGYPLPSSRLLRSIGALSEPRELEIGTVVRLNYRASAKLKFTDDVRELFGHLAYTGPISHEEVYRKVTTIGVHYYLYNKGKKERKVYIQGHLLKLPISVGVVKLGTQPMYLSELGATFCLYRRQIMSIYVGEIVLEGNSIGSFIKTGIRYYIGFGEERGVCPVFPNKTLGTARRLGINELLLHFSMVEDQQVSFI